MQDLFNLDGKIAVLTGGCGQLGQQFASTLLEYGAKVAVFDIVSKENTERLHYFKVDITDRKQVEKGLESVKQLWDFPHILINNAAIDSPPDAAASETGPFEDYPESSLDRIMNVNIKGTFICCQVIGGGMAKMGSGSIINIASIYGMVSPNQDIYAYKRSKGVEWYKPASYSITKSAIFNLTRYLATYWAKKSVRVNTLTPAGIFNNQDGMFLKEYTRRIPIGRMAKPDELNGAIIFLSSDASSYMTGANLVIDGGWTAW